MSSLMWSLCRFHPHLVFSHFQFFLLFTIVFALWVHQYCQFLHFIRFIFSCSPTLFYCFIFHYLDKFRPAFFISFLYTNIHHYFYRLCPLFSSSVFSSIHCMHLKIRCLYSLNLFCFILYCKLLFSWNVFWEDILVLFYSIISFYNMIYIYGL